MSVCSITNNKLNNINKYKNIYVMSDIHGCRETFYKSLKAINFNEEDLLIVLGDVIDRGKYSLELLIEMLEYPNIIILKGNHEDMMLKAMYGDYEVFENWINYNGGDNTYKSLMSLDKSSRYLLLSKVKNLMEYLILTINNKPYLLVHAGLYIIANMDLEELLRLQGSNLLWIRSRFLKSTINTPYTVIFGHTQTNLIDYEISDNYPDYFFSDKFDLDKLKAESEKARIWKSKIGNKIGIDCGVFSGGHLAILRLNDMKEFYIK